MVKKNILIKDIDEKSYNMFAGYCKANGLKVGDGMTKLIDDFVGKFKKASDIIGKKEVQK